MCHNNTNLLKSLLNHVGIAFAIINNNGYNYYI